MILVHLLQNFACNDRKKLIMSHSEIETFQIVNLSSLHKQVQHHYLHYPSTKTGASVEGSHKPELQRDEEPKSTASAPGVIQNALPSQRLGTTGGPSHLQVIAPEIQ